MNCMQRVLAAMKGDKADRKAVTLTLSLYGSKLTGCPSQTYYTNAEAYFQGQMAVVDQCDPDILFTPFALTAEAEAFGSEVVYLDKYPPNLKKPAVHDINQFITLNLPDVDSHPRLLYIRESTRLLSAAYQNKIPIAGILTTPIDLPALLMGIDNWLETLLFDPDNTRRILEKTTDFFITWANTLIDDGANFLVLPSMFSNPKIITQKIVETILLPFLIETLAKVKGPIVFHHGGNPIEKFLEMYSHLPNVCAFAVDTRDNLSEARRKIGPGRILLGNINGPNLFRLKPEHITHLCNKVLEDRKDDHSFILATSSADVAYDTPLENIRAMVDAAKNFK